MGSLNKTKFVIIHRKPLQKTLIEYGNQLELELELELEPEVITVSQKPPQEKKRGILVTSLFGDEKI